MESDMSSVSVQITWAPGVLHRATAENGSRIEGYLERSFQQASFSGKAENGFELLFGDCVQQYLGSKFLKRTTAAECTSKFDIERRGPPNVASSTLDRLLVRASIVHL